MADHVLRDVCDGMAPARAFSVDAVLWENGDVGPKYLEFYRTQFPLACWTSVHLGTHFIVYIPHQHCADCAALADWYASQFAVEEIS